MEVSLTGLRDPSDGEVWWDQGARAWLSLGALTLEWPLLPLGQAPRVGGLTLKTGPQADVNPFLWFPSAELGQTGIFERISSNFRRKHRL